MTPTPLKYPQNRHTHKKFIFLKTLKILKFKILKRKKKNHPSLRMYETTLHPPGALYIKTRDQIYNVRPPVPPDTYEHLMCWPGRL